MNNSYSILRIKVCYPAWSDAEKSWYLLVDQSPNKKGWSNGIWFPKKVCKLIPPEEEHSSEGILELPRWLYDKKFKTDEYII